MVAASVIFCGKLFFFFCFVFVCFFFDFINHDYSRLICGLWCHFRFRKGNKGHLFALVEGVCRTASVKRWGAQKGGGENSP